MCHLCTGTLLTGMGCQALALQGFRANRHTARASRRLFERRLGRKLLPGPREITPAAPMPRSRKSCGTRKSGCEAPRCAQLYREEARYWCDQTSEAAVALLHSSSRTCIKPALLAFSPQALRCIPILEGDNKTTALRWATSPRDILRVGLAELYRGGFQRFYYYRCFSTRQDQYYITTVLNC